jgi:hypothetical protein
MALKTIVQLLDDIDGKPADETVAFSLDGVSYEIDLNAKNADRLRKAFTPYLEKGRKAGVRKAGGRGRTGTRTAHTRERAADIRAWAKQHGITVNDRGRIPTQVVQAYEANDPSKAKETATRVPKAEFSAGA